MRKILLYGSPHCSGCGPVKEVFEKNNIKFAYLDITGNMLNLKKFLKIRDEEESHKSVREGGYIGIPTLFVDNKTYVLDTAEDAQKLINELNLKEE